MLRFLVVRVLAVDSGPVRDEPDHLRDHQRAARATTATTSAPMMITQGNATFAAADAAAERYREAARAERPDDGAVLPLDRRHRHPRRLRLVLLLQHARSREVVGERLPRTIALALTCHLLASVFGIGFGILAATRQYSWIDTALSFISFLGMTDPALPARADHPLRPRLQAERAGDRQLLLVAVRRRALELGQVRQPRPAHLAGGLRRDLRRARLQHAGDAGEPARHAERAVRRDRPRQGPVRGRGDHEARGAERAAPAGRLPGRGAALHADRRDRGRDRLRRSPPSARPSSARCRSATSTSPRRCCSCSAPR